MISYDSLELFCSYSISVADPINATTHAPASAGFCRRFYADKYAGCYQRFDGTVGDSDWFYTDKYLEKATDFHLWVRLYQQRIPHWVDWLPIKEILNGLKSKEPGEEGSDILPVDIGDSNGHYLQFFQKKFQHIDGRRVLQELPYVIERLQLLRLSRQ